MTTYAYFGTSPHRGRSPSPGSKRPPPQTPSPLKGIGGGVDKKQKLSSTQRDGSISPLPTTSQSNDAFTSRRSDEPWSSASVLRNPSLMPWDHRVRAAMKENETAPEPTPMSDFHSSDWGSKLDHSPISQEKTADNISVHERIADENVREASKRLEIHAPLSRKSSKASNKSRSSSQNPGR